jgi:2-polyprenyl-3-methyl-5-hydroxy-6-metoxy-1,4-benzoquinol methylase
MVADTLVGKISRAVLGQTLTTKLYINLTHRGHIVSFDQLSSESEEYLINNSRKRWEQAKPDLHLTWNMDISGDAFIQGVLMHTAIQSSKNILEVGPGWGRLLKAILQKNISFKNYYGIDISRENIAYLKNTFQIPNIHFIHGNIEDIKLDTTFDIVISSLTFKHMYPSFEKALTNISRYMNKKGMVFFDLLKEGNIAFFEEDGVTFIRYYKKKQIKEIVQRSNLGVVGFDKVIHAPGYSRLLVVAQKN